MRQYFLMAIAGLVAVIMGLITVERPTDSTETHGFASRQYTLSNSNNAALLLIPQTSNAISEDPHGRADLQQMAHTVDSSAFLPATLVSQTAPDSYFAPAPLPLLPPEAMSEVSPSQLPPLDAGMVNVTGDAQLTMHNAQLTMHSVQLGGGGADNVSQAGGYRMVLLSANSEYQITIPYDPSLLPQGFTEDDIQTYVYDNQYHRWVAIQRDSVNMEELLICSRFRPWEKALPGNQKDRSNPQDVLAQVQGMMSVNAQGDGGGDSPLDFINAVLKTPEMPETSAYTPTSIKELKAADPLEGLTLMQPPTANNSGTANMSYPIEIPAGRQGMQPNLALTYSSSGGNGWLGVGWDISIPSITVETRWGVPRYRSAWESEVYVYEGEQLVTKDNNSGEFRKMAHRTNDTMSISRISGDVQHFHRKNEVFDSIVRHGNGPDNYWWTVTHKNGVTDYYGKHALDSDVDNSCVLRSGDDNTSGAIAHWTLAESIDPFGNSVKYEYNVDIDQEEINKGKQIYLKEIRYTCYNTSDQGKYRIHFVSSFNQREDIVVSANRGFKEKSRGLLDRMEIFYNDTLIRTYYFHTKNERRSNYKTRLENFVVVYGDCRLPMLEPEGPKLDSLTDYSCIEKDSTNGCQLVRYKFDYFDYPTPTNLYSSEDTMTLVNDDVKYKCVLNTFHSTALGSSKGKSWSLGATGAVGVGPDVSTTLVTLGFNGSYSNSKNEGLLTLVDMDGDGLADKLFKKDKKIYYRKQIRTDDRHFSYGEEHELTGISDFLKESSDNGNFGLQLSAGASASFGVPLTKMSTTDYLADINGDGLMDVITEGGARFNGLNSHGIPSFSPINSIATSIPGQTGSSQTYISNQSLGTGQCGGFIYDGEVDPDIACDYQFRDDTIAFGDYNPVDNGITYDIIIGQICHVDSSQIDSLIVRHVYYWERMCNYESVYPDLDAVRVWVAPKDGNVTLCSSVRLLADNSESALQSRFADGVIYAIEHDRHCSLSGDMLYSNQAEEYVSGIIETGNDTVRHDTLHFSVHQDDLVFFRLKSRRDRSFDKVDWLQTIEYDSSSTNNDIYNLNEGFFQSDSEFVLVGRNVFQAPKRGTIKITGSLWANNIGQPARLYILRNESVVVDSIDISVSSHTEHNLNKTINVDSLDNITFEIRRENGTALNPIWSHIHLKPFIKYYADNQPGDLYAITDTLCYFPQVRMDIDHGTETPLRQHYHKLFGELYRGWGQFAYNNHDSLEVRSQCIDIQQLILPSFMTDTSTSQIDTNQFYISGQIDTNDFQGSMTTAVDSVYNPVSTKSRWVEMIAYGQRNEYRSHGLDAAVIASGLDNTPPVMLIPAEDSVAGALVYDSTVVMEQIQVYDHPVPVSVTGSPVQTIRKRHITKTFDDALSFDMLVASVGSSESSGNNYIQSDYMDLNGDRYPDPVSTGGTQYSMPWGGIGTLFPIPFFDNDHVSASIITSNGDTYGRCYPIPSRQPSNNSKLSKMSISAGGTNSESEVSSSDKTDYMLMDVNGDGLPDLVNTGISEGQSNIVCLNTGYGFLDGEIWGINYIRNGSSTIHSSSSGLQGGFSQENPIASNNSFNVAQCSIGGGTSSTETSNETTSQLMDVNGDGLPDKVEKLTSGIRVSYNLGNGSWSGYETINNVAISKSMSYSEDVNVGVTAGFTLLSILKINVGIQTSPKNHSFNTDCAQLVDINGDGYPDYVTSDREDRMYVRYNTAGKTNLLRKVTNFTGNTVELDYQLSQPCFEKPQRGWNLTEVKTSVPPVSSESANTTLNTFEYRNPHYDRYERLEYGYDTVITREHNTMDNNLVYRQNITGYNNVNFFKRGRKTSETIADGDGNPYIEHLDQAVLYDFNGWEVSDSTCEVAGIYVGREVEATYYYEGHTPYSVVTAVNKEYDSKRNIIHYTNEGIVNGLRQEYFTADISYKHNMPHNLISLPDTIVVRDTAGVVLQKRTAQYNNRGKLKNLYLHNDSYIAESIFTYDSYGNVVKFKGPENANGDRLEYKYDYDNIVHTYPVFIKNIPLGYYSTVDYDFRFGKPTRTVDINGAEKRHYYDEVGRDTMILAPNEIADSVPYTIRMSYHPVNFKSLASNVFAPLFNPTLEPMIVSHAVTEHYDRQHEGDPIVTVLLSDGWGRAVQVKKDSEIHGQTATLVSGNVVYDCFGRVTKQYHPFESTLMDSVNRGNYHTNINLPFTATDYDLMDRQLKVKLPTGDSTTYDYDFGTLYGQQYFKTAVTDALGNTVTTLSGGFGQKLQVTMPYSTVTSFTYDPIGHLLNSTDPDSIVTYYHYDMLGQMIQREHPDAGTDSYIYDPAGNLTKHTNGLGDDINYRYHYNQLTDIEYPRYPANNVHYTYGAMGDTSNCAGRVSTVEDASGWQKFSYGKLGEVTKNIRTFALPFEEQPFTFVMKYEYDSWNRIQRMTYPDGEEVSYGYNKGGMLKSVTSVKNGIPYKYVSNILYNKFELRERVKYGNGTGVTYEYDLLQRLAHLVSLTLQHDTMQNITYVYDAVGNIKSINNVAVILANGLGGTYNNSYSYDKLYRLSEAAGNWQGGDMLNYNLKMEYHKNGRIKCKNLAANTIIPYGHGDVSYQRGYFYENSSQPNTLTRIHEQEWISPTGLGEGIFTISDNPITPSNPSVSCQYDFEWDATGNLTRHYNEIESANYDRRLCWDEENRLQGVVDATHQTLYQYDANGERTYKLTSSNLTQLINGHWSTYTIMDNATLYASPYLVATPKGYTKHYYAENERIASKIGMGGLKDICKSLCPDMTLQYRDPESECEEPRECFYEKLGQNQEHSELVMGECLGTSPEVEPNLLTEGLYSLREVIEENERECYWYHPDHLGSSSWISDKSGSAIQHLHYLPWGEDFVDQRSTNWNARYTFSAKEKDTETGLSYFGARYYSSDLSIWLSVDPMSDKYPSTSPYVYCRNNPIILIDPNGTKDRPFNALRDKKVNIKPGTATPISKTTGFGKTLFYSKQSRKNAYNCHSYAWHNSQGDPTPQKGDLPEKPVFGATLNRWDNNPADDIKEQNAMQLGKDEDNMPGDIVIYYSDANVNGQYDDGEFISHSAVVKTVDDEGYTQTVIGKMGEDGISENHPDAPGYYQKAYNPKTEQVEEQSRAYFRRQQTND